MEEVAPAPARGRAGGGRGGASLIRDLASCNKTTRDRALKLVLKTWLPAQSHLPSGDDEDEDDDEMKKLWKGLFYCVWHADKSAVQSDLIDRLSSLLLSLGLPLSLRYLSVFLLTLRREWPGIDALRLDKFYLLIRRFLHCSFLMLKNNFSWDLDVSRRLMTVLEENTFCADEKLLTGNGVNYHIASVFLDELRPFLPIKSEVLNVLFKPFLCVISKSQDKVLLGKVKGNVFDVLLRMGSTLLELKKLGDNNDSDEKSDVVVLGTIGLALGFSGKLYELGTSPDCVQGNRKVLFSLHEGFLRLEKDLASSGIEISIPDAMVDDEVEVLKLIPTATEVEGSAGKTSKKNKKAKKAADVQLDEANKKALKTKKKKKKQGLLEQCSALVEKGNAIVANGENSSNGVTSDETNLIFNESVISNLQMQFEKVAAEIALGKGDSSSFDSLETPVRTTTSKKRKRARSTDVQDTRNQDVTGEEDGRDTTSAVAKSLDKSAKKVRFSMKNNLVWKPQTPLPPQNLRLPPSVTPRGSALKKGIPPGPIREMLPVTKKGKQPKKKKGRKGIKTISPAIKRLRKLQTLSV